MALERHLIYILHKCFHHFQEYHVVVMNLNVVSTSIDLSYMVQL
jgi:hypothetical protein